MSSFSDKKHLHKPGLADIFQTLGTSATTFLLMHENQAVGWAELSVIGTLSAAASVEIATEYRGLGLGKFLMKNLLAAAQQKGARQCLLQVRTGNEAARKLYRSLGFNDLYGYRYLKAI